MQDIIDCIRAELGAGTTKTPFSAYPEPAPRTAERGSACVSRAALLFRPREVQGTMFGDGGMGRMAKYAEIPCDASGRCRMQYGDCDASE
ncbi:hypothetical protein DMI70_22555 [Escherichia coli]|nr:hypothetical protein [Escherichia coli]